MAVNPAEALRTPPEPTISRFDPKDLGDDVFHGLKITKLFREGANCEGDPLDVISEAADQMRGKDTVNYFAISQEKAVGLLSVEQWTPDGSKSSKEFWETLLGSGPKVYERALSFSPLAMHVTMIVILPDFRGYGVAQRLFRFAVGNQTPSFVLGGSKRPEAVRARTNALAMSGYRTFYGTSEVTPHKQKDQPVVHIPVMNAFAKAIGLYDGMDEEEGIYVTEPSYILPTTKPDVSNFPDYIRRNFEKIIAVQETLGDSKTALKFLISVKEELLPKRSSLEATA